MKEHDLGVHLGMVYSRETVLQDAEHAPALLFLRVLQRKEKKILSCYTLDRRVLGDATEHMVSRWFFNAGAYFAKVIWVTWCCPNATPYATRCRCSYNRRFGYLAFARENSLVNRDNLCYLGLTDGPQNCLVLAWSQTNTNRNRWMATVCVLARLVGHERVPDFRIAVDPSAGGVLFCAQMRSLLNLFVLAMLKLVQSLSSSTWSGVWMKT